MASTSTKIIIKSEPHSYFHMVTKISFIEPSTHLFYMYYVSGSKLGDGETSQWDIDMDFSI